MRRKWTRADQVEAAAGGHAVRGVKRKVQVATAWGGQRALAGLVAAVLAALWLVSPFLLEKYDLYILNVIAVNALLAIGLNVVLGTARQFALSSAAFYGVGAYVSALAQLHLGVGFFPGLIAAGIAGGLIAALVSMTAWRVGGLYLAMITFGFGEIFQFFLVHADAITNGPDGLAVPRPVTGEGGLVWLFTPVLAVMIGAAVLLHRGALGRVLVALGDSEEALSSLGLSPKLYKTIAFAISGVFASVAGAMIVAVVGFVDPYSFGLEQTLLHLTMVAVGGFGSLVGALAGATSLTLLAEVLRQYHGIQEIVYGAVLLLVFYFFPGGLAGLPTALRRLGRRR